MEQLDYHLLYRQFVRPPAAVYFCSADRSPKRKCFCVRDANGQSVDRVTLTQGAVAVAVATNALAQGFDVTLSAGPLSYAQKFDERAKSRSRKFLSFGFMAENVCCPSPCDFSSAREAMGG